MSNCNSSRNIRDTLKVLAILSATAVKKYSVEGEGLKQYWNLKKDQILWNFEQDFYSKGFYVLTTDETQ